MIVVSSEGRIGRKGMQKPEGRMRRKGMQQYQKNKCLMPEQSTARLFRTANTGNYEERNSSRENNFK